MAATLIVGGGIGGMTAAAALAQRGMDVTVLEAAPAFGEVGAGVTLSPNAMHGMADIGVADAVVAAGVQPAQQRIQHWHDGRTLLTLERSDMRTRYGAPYVYIHRADLHAILVDAARSAGTTLVTDAAVRTIEDRHVTLHGGQTVDFDLLIGADGLKSVVRALFEPAAAHFTGHVAWRALLPVTDSVRELSERPGMHIGPGRMVVRYPVRGGTLLNSVFYARQDGWNDEGWTILAPPEDLQNAFADWCPEVMALVDGALLQPTFKWAINARTALPNWLIDDRITLLGDAAHAMTPFMGQGAASAIEDAIVLARAMHAFPKPADAFSHYIAARHERTSFVQAESNANADRMQGPETDLFGLANLRNEETLGLFDYDCGSVPL
jgi:salicylate hydroxylase